MDTLYNGLTNNETHLAEGIQMSKVYTRRDSVTAILRKMGIDKEAYSKFIKVVDGGFQLNMKMEASEPAKPVKAKAPAAKKSGKKSQPPVKVVYEEITEPSKAYRVDPNNITNTIKTLILDGKTNKEIWDIIQPSFKMEDNKRHYPAWYRSQMKRKGQLS